MKQGDFEATLDRVRETYARPLFFVVGPPKSGTTWLQLMLDGHPEIHCAGEGHFTDWIGEPLKELLSDYNKKIKFNNDFIFGDQRYYSGFTHGDYRFLMALVISYALAQQDLKPGTKWIGEKTPINTYNLDFLHEILPMARFVGILRDPRDAMVSIIQQRIRLGDDPTFQVGSKSYKDFAETFAKKWVTVWRDMRKFADRYPAHYIETRYEALHQDPACLASILEFLSVDTSPQGVAACVEAGDFKRHAGGRERGQSDSASFFRKGLAGSWEDDLDGVSLESLLQIAEPEMRDAGYL